MRARSTLDWSQSTIFLVLTLLSQPMALSNTAMAL